MEQILIIGSIILFASFTFSFAGFGFSLVAVPLLTLLMDTQEAVLFQYPYALIMAIYLAAKSRKHLIWRQIWVLLLGATIGLPVGVYVLSTLSEHFVKKALGLFVMGFVITSALPVYKMLGRIAGTGRFSALFCGLLSGAFQGAYNTGGPPIVIYAIAANEDRIRAKGIILSVVLYLYVLLLIPYGFGKSLTLSGLMNNLYYLPAMVGGTWFGTFLFERVDNTNYRNVILMLLFVASLFLLFRN